MATRSAKLTARRLPFLGVGVWWCASAKPGSCWSAGFSFEHCCAPEHGTTGNTECWDDMYTYDACCVGSDLDPADVGCGSNYFLRFKGLLDDYYSEGHARPALISMLSGVLGSFETRLELCAPAALQALLLRIEERSLMEPARVTADRLNAYAVHLQRAMARGLLSKMELQTWPLEAGLQRIRDSNWQKRTEAPQLPRSGTKRPARLAMVLSYCNEGLSWMNTSLSPWVIRQTELVIVRKCPQVTVELARVVPHHWHWRSVRSLNVEDLPLRADECSAYLGYLLQEYEHLPRHMLFVHADAPEHIGGFERPNIIDDTLRAVLQGAEVPFAHLGGNRITMGWDQDTMGVLWRGLFSSTLVPGPSEVQAYCCSHFIVSRDRVQLRPRSFFERAHRFITSPSSYSYLPVLRPHASARDLQGRVACQNMMFLWHVIFGERLHLPHRMFDADLPLFLKVRNVRTAYLDL